MSPMASVQYCLFSGDRGLYTLQVGFFQVALLGLFSHLRHYLDTSFVDIQRVYATYPSSWVLLIGILSVIMF
jgi:hypothetical protein